MIVAPYLQSTKVITRTLLEGMGIRTSSTNDDAEIYLLCSKSYTKHIKRMFNNQKQE